MEGALFFDWVYNFYYGNWTTDGSDDYYRWKDGENDNGSWWTSYNSNSSADINYAFNNIEFYYDGYRGCEITTSYYVPTPSYSKTKAYDFGGYDSVSKCESVSIK